MGKQPVFYILGGTKPLDYFGIDNDPIFGSTLDKLLYSFPKLVDANLQGFGRAADSGRVGVVLGIDRRNLQLVTYDEQRFCNWNWPLVERGRLVDIFTRLMRNTLKLQFELLNEATELRDVRTTSPYIVYINCSDLSNKGGPTPRRFDDFVLKNVPDAETHLLYEEGKWPVLHLAECGIPTGQPLDRLIGHYKPNAVIDARIAAAGQKYCKEYRASLKKENQ